MAVSKSEVILHLAAEGGGISLFGLHANNEWRFSREVLDYTPEMIDEDRYQHTSSVVTTWPAALALLDEYPWVMLSPREVHPDFRKAFYEAALNRLSKRAVDSPNQLQKWRYACLEGA